ncbi:MAG TPA: AAA family ATPase [Saprospiraceae bacterium]|nr:AAA family ATPase [Saprospiraceae bacterium]HMQ85624.1 AAA family ATPase [Saprospiraceae bacterium]
MKSTDTTEEYLQPEFNKFKFKELKVYASTEWLADNKKKYRQVFDRYETAYVYAELSFHNKYFDIEDWEVDVELKCYSIRKGQKLLCSLPFKRKVSKYDNVMYIREGWGNKNEGAFWKKGTYFWEAWIEGEKVATKYFYIEDAGKEANADISPYLEVQSLKLYEGPYDDVIEDERIYYKTFSSEETRYIYVEITLRNVNNTKSWHCELFTKFYNDARELKGQVVRLQRIEKKDDTIRITAGWGSNVKGSWRKDRYTAEIVFMDHLLAVVPFSVSDDYEEGHSGVLMPDRISGLVLSPDESLNQTFEDIMAGLDALIGLDAIKKQVRDHAKYIQFLQLRREKGFEEKEEINVHSVFIGNPGTGKTTVAKKMGLLYRKMGLLSKGHVLEVDRVDLVGEYIGQTAPKVKEVIEKARGGVLFIDEAYALARSQDDTKDFGREVIEILVKEMSNGSGDLAVIVAGYPKEMNHFLNSNPGLKSRFKLYFEFSDYLPQELSRIAEFACEEKGVRLIPEAKTRIDEMIVHAYRKRDRTFGNARFVFDLIEKSKVNMGLRIMSSYMAKELSKEALETIQLTDVSKIQLESKPELPNIPVDEGLLQESLAELNSLIGMEKVKEQINELVRLVRYYRETGRDVLNMFSFHTVFIGNPGTGKTTVARILAKIYKALGVLERGHTVETDRQGLVAGYLGQTAIKTTERIDEAMGGVLFIDEAYALTMRFSNGGADFGDESIQTLLKRMEDHRGQFFVFVAGYPDNMEQFLKANPGLNSRFDKVLKFEDYNPQELFQIAIMMLAERGLSPDEAAEAHLKQYLEFIYEYRDKYFGNARAVRGMVMDAIKYHNLRLAALPPAQRLQTPNHVLTMEDVQSFRLDKSDFVFNKKSIGFLKKREGGGAN